MIRPIPANADYRDPMYQGELIMIAREMVTRGMRMSVIQRLIDGIPRVMVTRLYRTIRNEAPPPGTVFFGQAPDYTNRMKYGSGFNLQATLFLNIYLRIERSFDYELHRAWLLVVAYKGFCEAIKEMDARHQPERSFTIDRAYAVLYHSGVSSVPELADLGRRICDCCGAAFLINHAKELDTQQCPVCASEANQQRLVSQAADQNRKKSASRD